MAREKKNNVAITFRGPPEWDDRAKAIADAIAPPGASFSASDGYRAAIAIGFDVLEGRTETVPKRSVKRRT